MSYSREITENIFRQFGGGKAMAMIGGSLVHGADFSKVAECPNPQDTKEFPFLMIKFKAKANKIDGKSPNLCFIVYNQAGDYYQVHFARIHGTNLSFLGNWYDVVYCDNLTNIFESTTGLYLSL